MTRTGFAVLIGAVITTGAFAQSEPTNVILAAGTALNAELNSSADSKKAKVDDKVEAQTTVDLKSDGRVLIPKGTKLFGHITRASARAKGDSESVLAIQFEKAVTKNGEEIPLNVEIRAIAPPQRDISGGLPSSNSDPMSDRGGAAAGGSPMGSPRPMNPATVTPNPANYPPASDTQGGPLAANSRGVYGMRGVQLASDTSKTNTITTITSTAKNVHLEGGTRLLLVVQGESVASGNK